MPRNVSGQCTGKNKRNGQRCKRKSARGPLCYAHLAIEKGLRIKKSTLGRGSGLGLFALKDFEKNQIITPYGGRIVHTDDPDYGGDYILQLGRTKYIDGDPKKTNTSIGAFSNNCRPQNRRARQCTGNNAKFANHTANVKATKKIKKGAEIFSAYGRTYW